MREWEEGPLVKYNLGKMARAVASHVYVTV